LSSTPQKHKFKKVLGANWVTFGVESNLINHKKFQKHEFWGGQTLPSQDAFFFFGTWRLLLKLFLMCQK
jgi:hypothetical protein